jgi:hypothetical protein
VDHNRLTSLASVAAPLPALRELYLSHNGLTALPPRLGALLPCLEVLDVSHNRLGEGWRDAGKPAKASGASPPGAPSGGDVQAVAAAVLAPLASCAALVEVSVTGNPAIGLPSLAPESGAAAGADALPPAPPAWLVALLLRLVPTLDTVDDARVAVGGAAPVPLGDDDDDDASVDTDGEAGGVGTGSGLPGLSRAAVAVVAHPEVAVAAMPAGVAARQAASPPQLKTLATDEEIGAGTDRVRALLSQSRAAVHKRVDTALRAAGAPASMLHAHGAARAPVAGVVGSGSVAAGPVPSSSAAPAPAADSRWRVGPGAPVRVPPVVVEGGAGGRGGGGAASGASAAPGGGAGVPSRPASVPGPASGSRPGSAGGRKLRGLTQALEFGRTHAAPGGAAGGAGAGAGGGGGGGGGVAAMASGWADASLGIVDDLGGEGDGGGTGGAGMAGAEDDSEYAVEMRSSPRKVASARRGAASGLLGGEEDAAEVARLSALPHGGGVAAAGRPGSARTRPMSAKLQRLMAEAERGAAAAPAAPAGAAGGSGAGVRALGTLSDAALRDLLGGIR